MYNIQSKNLTQLKKELKTLEGKAILKLTRSNSLNDGEFLRVLHKVKTNEIIFWDGEQKIYLSFPKAKDIIIDKVYFQILNCKYEIIEVKQ